MRYNDFLTRVINDGIEAASISYASDKQKREGAIAGFELCRMKQPTQLKLLLKTVERQRKENRRQADYWWWRCRELEVGWVCNVVSAALLNSEWSSLMIVNPTARGVIKASQILGVEGTDKWMMHQTPEV